MAAQLSHINPDTSLGELNQRMKDASYALFQVYPDRYYWPDVWRGEPIAMGAWPGPFGLSGRFALGHRSFLSVASSAWIR